jgi:hypothetical protein
MKILKLLFLFLLPTQIYANTQYTIEDVGEHNTPQDCWVTFEDGVYDLSEYLPDHDRFMDIREWCGLDMTEDFKTKAGAGRDHKEFSYAMLEEYYIGQLVEEKEEEQEEDEVSIQIQNIDVEEDDNQIGTVDEKINSPYNLILPLLLTLVIYWTTYYIFKKKNFKKFNAFWNTLLFLTFLIPSFGFGIFMMLRYRFTNIRDINFDFMYWHVELSVVMGAIALSHFIQRLKQYLVQLKK